MLCHQHKEHGGSDEKAIIKKSVMFLLLLWFVNFHCDIADIQKTSEQNIKICTQKNAEFFSLHTAHF